VERRACSIAFRTSATAKFFAAVLPGAFIFLSAISQRKGRDGLGKFYG